jgi:hypothetical protein
MNCDSAIKGIQQDRMKQAQMVVAGHLVVRCPSRFFERIDAIGLKGDDSLCGTALGNCA